MVQTRGIEQEDFIRMNGLTIFGDSKDLKQKCWSRKRALPWSQSSCKKTVAEIELRAKSEIGDPLLSMLQAENFLNLANIQKSFDGQVKVWKKKFS